MDHSAHHHAMMALVSPFDLLGLAQILSLGFLTSWHCVGMCCPLYYAVCPSRKWRPMIQYQLARWLSYCCLGASFCYLTQASEWLHLKLAPWIATILSIGLAAGGLAKIRGKFEFGLKASFPRLNLPNKPLLLGLITGFLPCMTLAPAYVAAASSKNTPVAIMTMTGFFLGTLPALILANVIPKPPEILLNLSNSRWFLGSFWILTAMITLFRVWHN